MSKKIVTLVFDSWWECVLEIDETPETIKYMEEQLLFWSGGKQRISEENGNIEKAFLKMLGQEIVKLSVDYNVNGIIGEFDDKEGWWDIRGNHGVKLLSCDEFYIDSDEIEILE